MSPQGPSYRVAHRWARADRLGHCATPHNSGRWEPWDRGLRTERWRRGSRGRVQGELEVSDTQPAGEAPSGSSTGSGSPACISALGGRLPQRQPGDPGATAGLRLQSQHLVGEGQAPFRGQSEPTLLQVLKRKGAPNALRGVWGLQCPSLPSVGHSLRCLPGQPGPQLVSPFLPSCLRCFPCILFPSLSLSFS